MGPHNNCHTKLEEGFSELGVEFPGAPGGMTNLDDDFFWNLVFPIILRIHTRK